MFKRLPLITALLTAISLAFVALIVREATTTQRARAGRPQPTAAAPAAPAAPAAAPSPAPAGGYTTVVSRNLFSPTRTEAPPPPPTPVAAAPVINLPKPPNLYGVVLQDGTPVAYLEDPTTKRVIRYRVGDSIAGGTLQTINSDSVVLSRPDGQIAVRLHDPTRPRTAPPVPAGPGGLPAPAAQVPPRPQSFVTPETHPQPGTPLRRPLSPSVLGRILPQGPNAPTPQ